MKHLIIITIIIVMAVSGCTTVHYNPETKDFHYQGGLLGRKVEYIGVIREKDGTILFEMRNYETEKTAELAGKIAEGVVRGIK